MNKRKMIERDAQEIERGFQASLHGAQYTPKLQTIADKGVERLSKEQDNLVDRYMEKRLEELKQQAKSNGVENG